MNRVSFFALTAHKSIGCTYIRHLILVRVVQNVVQHIHGRLRLDSYTGAHAKAVDVLDQLFGVGLLIAGSFGGLGGGRVDGGFVVEAVQIAAGFLEVLDPFLRLLEPVSWCILTSLATFRLVLLLCSVVAYLSDHHVAVKGALSKGLGRLLYVRADLGDDGCSEGDVGDEVAVHDVHVQPVCSMADGV